MIWINLVIQVGIGPSFLYVSNIELSLSWCLTLRASEKWKWYWNCVQKGDSAQIVSVDANFGLVRKRNGGQSLAGAKKNAFFVDQKNVDDKVERLPYCIKNDVVSSMCRILKFHKFVMLLKCYTVKMASLVCDRRWTVLLMLTSRTQTGKNGA